MHCIASFDQIMMKLKGCRNRKNIMRILEHKILYYNQGRIKRYFFYGAVQFDTCEAVYIFLIYILMIYAY